MPDIPHDPAAWRIPFWPRTALRLLEALGEGRRSRRNQALRALLAHDPGLVLWGLRVAAGERQRPFQSLGELAAWFSRRAVGRIAASGRRPARIDQRGYCQRVAEWNARARWLAQQARTQARLLGTADPERAELVGSVWLVRQWPDVEGPEAMLPDWLADLLDGHPSPELQGAVDAARRAAEVVETAEPRGLTLPDSPLPSDRTYALVYAGLRRWERHRRLRTQYRRSLEQAKLDSLCQFAYGAGHEINNPLTNIALRAEALLRGESDARRIRMLETIRAQAYRAYQMIADMMLYAKPPDLQLGPVRVADVVREVVADLNGRAQERQVQFTLSCQPGELEVLADSAQLAVALQAVVQNALEAVQRDGRVTLSVASAGNQAVISCRDTGPGLSDQDRRHLFDPFYSGREAGRGLGFGLSKAWRIVTLHGGWIRATSSEGNGTTVRIGLPQWSAGGQPVAVAVAGAVPYRPPQRAEPERTGRLVQRTDDPSAA